MITFSKINNGALVLNSGFLSYYQDFSVHNFVPHFSAFASYTAICLLNHFENNEVIIAVDAIGDLYQISYDQDNNNVPFYVQLIGKICPCQKLVYIDDGIFIAICIFGNSILFKIKNTTSCSSSLSDISNYVDLEIIDIHYGFGPIVDMTFIVDDSTRKNRYKRNQLIACSGTGLDASLRVFSDGIKINETHYIPFRDVKDIWVLYYKKEHFGILISSKLVSMYFEIINYGGKMLELSHVLSEEPTIYACNIIKNNVFILVQITKSQIRFISLSEPYTIIESWLPPDNSKITNVSLLNNGYLTLATEKGIYSLDTNSISTFYNIQVLNYFLYQNIFYLFQSYVFNLKNSPKFISVSNWNDNQIDIFDFMNGNIIMSINISKKRILSSFVMLETNDFSKVILFCSYNDGKIVCYYIDIDKKTCILKRNIIIPLSFYPKLKVLNFSDLKKVYIVGCSENTCFIELNSNLFYNENNENQDIILSVKISSVNNITTVFTNPLINDEVIYLKNNIIFFGNVAFKELYYTYKPYYLYETPRNICYQNETNTIAILTCQKNIIKSGKHCSISSKYLFEQHLLNIGILTNDQIENQIPISLLSPRIDVSEKIQNTDPDWEWVGNSQTFSLVILNKNTLRPLYTYKFHGNEEISALSSLNLGLELSLPYYVTCCNMITNPKSENYIGFVKLFQIIDNKIKLIDSIKLDCLILSICDLKRKLIIGTTGILYVYEMSIGNKLVYLNKIECGIMPIFLKVFENELIVGDIMNNITVMEFSDIEKGQLKVTLQNEMPSWTTCAYILKPGEFLCTNVHKYMCYFTKENSLLKLQNKENSDDDENDNIDPLVDDQTKKKIRDGHEKKYKISGKYYLGDHINSIISNSFQDLITGSNKLNERNDFTDLNTNKKILISGSSGDIKTLISLTKEQNYILNVIYSRFVQYYRLKMREESFIGKNNKFIYFKVLKKQSFGFIYGDFVKCILNMQKNDADFILSNIIKFDNVSNSTDQSSSYIKNQISLKTHDYSEQKCPNSEFYNKDTLFQLLKNLSCTS